MPKGDEDTLKRYTIKISNENHRRLKIAAAIMGKNMDQVIGTLIQDHIPEFPSDLEGLSSFAKKPRQARRGKK